MTARKKAGSVSKAKFRAYEITGDTPLMMHSARGADPMHPGAQALSELLKARKRKGADVAALTAEITRKEWEIGIYHSDLCGPYLTGSHVKAAMIEAAKADRMGSHVSRYVAVPLSRIPIEYDGPRDLDGLFDYPDMFFVDQRPVGVQRNKIIRTRPIFHEWAMTFFVKFRADSMSPDSLDDLMESASWCGIGDGRAIDMGRFTVTAAWEPTKIETRKMRDAGTGAS